MTSPILITLRGGAVLDLRAPDMSLITPELIAHALSKLCRFSGQCESFYSVAQHSVIVAHAVGSVRPDLGLQALLHDAAEAFTNDLSKNLKHSPELAGYRRIESNLQALIYQLFGLPMEANTLIKSVDTEVGERERNAFVLGKKGVVIPTPVSPDLAKTMFLVSFERFRWGRMRGASVRTH